MRLMRSWDYKIKVFITDIEWVLGQVSEDNLISRLYNISKLDSLKQCFA